jgi:hypothetical protein
MRRKVFAFTALLALLACSVAYATTSAGNKYAASISAAKSGTAHKPAPTSVTEKFTIKNAQSGHYAYPAININTVIGNIKVEHTSSYPTCTASQINKAGNSKGWNKVCKSASVIATGPVKAELYTPKLTTAGSGFACGLTVNVYNAGSGKLTFFLTTKNGSCGSLQTGAAAAWTATYKESGSSLNMNVPLPPDVSTKAGGAFWAAIQSETLNFKKLDTGGKPVIVSTGSKHAWKMTFTATTTGKNKVVSSVSGG